MPTYRYFCPICGTPVDIFKRLADFARAENCTTCQVEMTRVILPPAVLGDYQGYNCPVTGKWIEGRRAHEENLKRQQCRVLEPGEREQLVAEKARDEAEFDAKIDATVEEFVEKLPTIKKERLASEVLAGANVSFERR